jgi:hypothetical protein
MVVQVHSCHSLIASFRGLLARLSVRYFSFRVLRRNARFRGSCTILSMTCEYIWSLSSVAITVIVAAVPLNSKFGNDMYKAGKEVRHSDHCEV